MAMIITYDIQSRHIEVKAAMFRLGYKAEILDGANKTVYLPNTTLYYSSKTPATAVNDIMSICTSLGVRLERCIATMFSPDWAGIYGEPFNS